MVDDVHLRYPFKPLQGVEGQIRQCHFLQLVTGNVPVSVNGVGGNPGDSDMILPTHPWDSNMILLTCPGGSDLILPSCPGN